MRKLLYTLVFCGLMAWPACSQNTDQILILFDIYQMQMDLVEREMVSGSLGARYERIALKRTAIELGEKGVKGVAELSRLTDEYFAAMLYAIIDHDATETKIDTDELKKNESVMVARIKLNSWIEAKRQGLQIKK